MVSPSICYEVMGPEAMILVFWMLNFKPTFSLSFFTCIKRLFSSSSLSAIGWCHLRIWGYWYFSQQSWFQLVLHPAQCFSWCTIRCDHLYPTSVDEIISPPFPLILDRHQTDLKRDRCYHLTKFQTIKVHTNTVSSGVLLWCFLNLCSSKPPDLYLKITNL